MKGKVKGMNYTITLTENQAMALLGALRNESSEDEDNYYIKHYYAIAKKLAKKGFWNATLARDFEEIGIK